MQERCKCYLCLMGGTCDTLDLADFIFGVIAAGLFIGLMVYFIPLAYLVLTGHYLNFGG